MVVMVRMVTVLCDYSTARLYIKVVYVCLYSIYSSLKGTGRHLPRLADRAEPDNRVT
jgi:hypothetical protein